MIQRTIIFAILLIGLVSCQSEKTNTDASIDETPTQGPTAEETDQRRQQKRSEDYIFITGQFDPTKRSEFVIIEPEYGDKEDMYIQAETYEAFKKMHAAAAADGVSLVVRSATRNFDRQKEIWENKWTGKTLLDGGINAAEAYPDPEERAYKILEWSSMPGTSRHHWGTDIDINAFENAYFEEGPGKKVYDWMLSNASDYGFCQPYTEKGPKRTWGYNEEKWHWTYHPLSKLYLSEANASLQNEDINGFLGDETAAGIMVKEKYMLGINAECY
jgi:LAS superfamily LD-carboxypeptidase LdcB